MERGNVVRGVNAPARFCRLEVDKGQFESQPGFRYTPKSLPLNTCCEFPSNVRSIGGFSGTWTTSGTTINDALASRPAFASLPRSGGNPRRKKAVTGFARLGTSSSTPPSYESISAFSQPVREFECCATARITPCHSARSSGDAHKPAVSWLGAVSCHCLNADIARDFWHVTARIAIAPTM